jgi:hypothetical protein
MGQGPSREAKNSTASQEFPRILRKTEDSSPHSQQPAAYPSNDISFQSTLSHLIS